MYTIKTMKTNELQIKNSKFLSYLYPVEQLSQIHEILDDIKKEHPKASHYCYSYILFSHEKAFDDQEPKNTAGQPMLHVLKQNEMMNVLCVTVRYFGGIKLGAGGLTRAYSKSCRDVLKKATLLQLFPAKLIRLDVSYQQFHRISYLLKQFEIVEKTFDTDIHLLIKVKKEDLPLLLEHHYLYQEIEDCYLS